MPGACSGARCWPHETGRTLARRAQSKSRKASPGGCHAPHARLCSSQAQVQVQGCGVSVVRCRQVEFESDGSSVSTWRITARRQTIPQRRPPSLEFRFRPPRRGMTSHRETSIAYRVCLGHERHGWCSVVGGWWVQRARRLGGEARRGVRRPPKAGRGAKTAAAAAALCWQWSMQAPRRAPSTHHTHAVVGGGARREGVRLGGGSARDVQVRSGERQCRLRLRQLPAAPETSTSV